MSRIQKTRFTLALISAVCLSAVTMKSARSQLPPGSSPSASVGGPYPGAMSMPAGSGFGSADAGMGMGPAQTEEIRYAQEAFALLQQYAAESSDESKTDIKNRLRITLKNQFRLQHMRRDEELKSIEKRLAELRQKLEKRAEAINTIVDRRLEQLVSDVDGLGWGADDIPQDFLNSGFGPSGSGMPGMGPGSMGSPGMMSSPGTSGMMPGAPGRGGAALGGPPALGEGMGGLPATGAFGRASGLSGSVEPVTRETPAKVQKSPQDPLIPKPDSEGVNKEPKLDLEPNEPLPAAPEGTPKSKNVPQSESQDSAPPKSPPTLPADEPTELGPPTLPDETMAVGAAGAK